jgi:3-oxoacyl-[acyl-carrier protein] reductase
MASSLAENPLDLTGRVAVVTGSTRGIGWAIARCFATHGATVVLNGRDGDRLRARADELGELTGTPGRVMAADAKDPGAIRDGYRAVFNEFRRLDVLVNNAGVLGDALIGMISDELLEETFAVNTLGPIHHLQNAARLMKRAGGGSVINLTSIMAVRGNAGQVPYTAAKAAVIGSTLSAAKELAPDNIRVNAIAPGYIETDMTRGLAEDQRAERVSSIGLGRAGDADEVAGVALFLASGLSTYVTGQVIGVDGGMVV